MEAGFRARQPGRRRPERKEYGRAESLFLEVLQRYEETVPAEHVGVGIVRIRLGRAPLGQRRYEEAQTQTAAGLEILRNQARSPPRWLKVGREALAATYDALNQPEKAASVRAEMAQGASIAPALASGR